MEQSQRSTLNPSELKRMVEDEVRDKLTVRVVVSIVPEGTIERPGTQKEKLLERIKVS